MVHIFGRNRWNQKLECFFQNPVWCVTLCNLPLVDGFKYVLFPPPGEMIQFEEHIFQMGWFNHQIVPLLLVKRWFDSLNQCESSHWFSSCTKWWNSHGPGQMMVICLKSICSNPPPKNQGVEWVYCLGDWESHDEMPRWIADVRWCEDRVGDWQWWLELSEIVTEGHQQDT